MFHKIFPKYIEEFRSLIRQAQLNFITEKTTCFDLINRSSSGPHTNWVFKCYAWWDPILYTSV